MKKIIAVGLLCLAVMSSCKEETEPTPVTGIQTVGNYYSAVGVAASPIQGTVKGGATKTADSKGVDDAAWALDGVDDFIEIEDNALYKPAALTISFWTSIAETKRSNGIVFKSNGQSSFDEAYGVFGTNLNKFAGVAARDFTEPVSYALATYTLNKWYHIAYTLDNKSGSLYIDGVLQETKATNFELKHAVSPLLLGHYPFSKSYYKGKIADFRFYGKALTATEVAALAK